MGSWRKNGEFRWRAVGSFLFLTAASLAGARLRRGGPECIVEAEEVVTSYAPANNGAGPLWCYGSTVIVRQGQDVYVSTIETGKDVPLLCNTRWQLWRRSAGKWRIEQSEKEFRQREPCPLVVFEGGPVFLSANPSTEPPGTKYGRCRPVVFEFDAADPTRLGGPKESAAGGPVWADGAHFTDHSYRGFAADGVNGELLLLNIHAGTGEQYVSYCDASGRWHQKGKIEFPIRSCYPQVALRAGAAHVMAIGDIVEPVEEWRKLKFEKLKNNWDYVFRRLFYTWTPNINDANFAVPIEIDTVERTCGHITNLDLYIDETGAAHLLYLKRPHQYAFIRDKYFPGEDMTAQLEYVVVKAGKVASRRTLTKTAPDSQAIEPSFGRFHIGSDGGLYVIVSGAGGKAGAQTFGNYVGRVIPGSTSIDFTRLALKHPFGNFFTNTVRGGSAPSDTIDLFGIADDDPNLRYARIRLEIR
ncbi:MAG TPA: hypothetical protein VJJ98_02405 [Sedimentisphaerales bacterium]|nr:hypothetical protein [Sedimentisphaerales bacterium]